MILTKKGFNLASTYRTTVFLAPTYANVGAFANMLQPFIQVVQLLHEAWIWLQIWPL